MSRAQGKPEPITGRAISYYNSAKDVSPSREITIREFCRMVHDGETAAAVAKVRTAGSEDEKKAAKMRLPAVQLSGHVTEGNRAKAMEEGRFLHSGFLQLDVDGNGLNGKTPEEARAMLASDPHVLSAFISPSGQGAKALFRVKPCATGEEHKEYFAAAEKHVLETYGLAIDPLTKDPGRLCYLPSDPQCTWNGNPVEFVAPESNLENQVLITPPASLVIRSKAFPEPPEHGIHSWLMEAAWHCRLHDRMTEAEAVAKLESYNGTMRRSLQPNEARDAARTVFSTPLEQQAKTPPPKPDPETLRARAYAMRFDPNETPPPDETCMVIGDIPIAARGNLTVPQGKSKVGKSAVVSAVMGAAHRGEYQTAGDTLCIEWNGEATGAIIHMDTEQSRADWHALVCRGITRSGMREVSPRLVSLPLVMFSRSERLAILKQTLAFEREGHGTIDLVMIDGVADLCISPNDEAEALELVSQLHALAQEYDCPIFCVLHENPSSEIGKTRGHLGSELNRKAFANLRIDKDTETSVSTLYGTDMRKRDIPRELGFCFAWDTEAGMHTFQGRAAGLKAAQAESKAIEKARAEWEPIYDFAADNRTNGVCPFLTAAEAADVEADMNRTKKKATPDTMRKRMERAENLGVLRRIDRGQWSLIRNGQTGQETDKRKCPNRENGQDNTPLY